MGGGEGWGGGGGEGRDKIASIIEGGPLRLNLFFRKLWLLYTVPHKLYGRHLVSVCWAKASSSGPLDKCDRQRNGTRAYSVGKSQLCFLYQHFPMHHNKQ